LTSIEKATSAGIAMAALKIDMTRQEKAGPSGAGQ
jgi:hypothetical protein